MVLKNRAASCDQAYYYPGHFLHTAHKINMQFSNVVFTCNNYTNDQYQYIIGLPIFKYLIVGKEIGAEGTPHLQGYGVLRTRTRSLKLRKLLPGCHLEPRKGTHDQASFYCKKDGDFVEIGEPPKQGKRTDLEEVAEKLKEGVSTTDICRDNTTTYIKFYRGIEQAALKLQTPYEHSGVRGIWVHGPPGTGKSWSVRQQFPGAFLKAQNKWWDGYNGERYVILDDLDTPVLFHYLKIWADRYACTGETKGGTIHLRHHVFVITSNYHPLSLFPVERDDCPMYEAIHRRFEIYEKSSLDDKILYKN